MDEKICVDVQVDKVLADHVEAELLENDIVLEEAISRFISQVVDNHELPMLLDLIEQRKDKDQ